MLECTNIKLKISYSLPVPKYSFLTLISVHIHEIDIHTNYIYRLINECNF
jgi:hypothetical protein